jgi:TetR/AcrR family transcriptional regulator, transcriptional repressor for nem operon
MARKKAFDPGLALDQATELFWRHGYDHASIAKLLAATQLSRQSLYDTFGDKHSLYLACLRHYRARVRALFAEVLAEQHSATARLRALFEFDLTAERSSEPIPTRRSCLMANAALELGPRDPAVREEIAAHLREVENSLVRIVIEGQLSGELDREQDARALARFLTNALHGLGVLACGGAPLATLRDAIATTLRMVERAPGRRPQAPHSSTSPCAQA